MKFTRHYSDRTPVETQVRWGRFDSKITAADGSIVFEMKDVEAPESWSQGAVDILAQKYLRKAGVPSQTTNAFSNEEDSMPKWLLPHKSINDLSTDSSETSAHQVFYRLAGCWTYWGWKSKLFSSEEDARIFYDETYLMLARQIAAPNSPQFFNTGLHWAYGIDGPDCGQWAFDNDGNVFETHDSYSRPNVHACYIQPLADDLVNPGGIMDLALREAKVFKHGSGSGSNVSNIRATGEKLSGGGTSSGLISFLRVLDRAAGAIKSGGVTRRAAKMVILDLDHPDIEEFIHWKYNEEQKARALVAAGYSEAEALETISGQNANNSVRVPNRFLSAIVDKDVQWGLYERTTGKATKYVKAYDLWTEICHAAWLSGDPGVQFSDTINSWHTCKADGDIIASNPCSEYLFLTNTACNLASLNLVKFLDSQSSFDTRAFEHAVRIWTAVLDISVTMASYPSREIAEGTYKYRTLGLGYANLGGLLMRKGIAYDSAEGRRIAAQVTAQLQYAAYSTSAEMAVELGAFPRYEENKNHISNVLAKHDAASRGVIGTRYAVDAKVRNAQVSVTAPTGTIALLMDCDTTGIEPDFSLVKLKKLAGGGEMKIVNQSVPVGLKSLGYTTTQIAAILAHIEKTGTVLDMPPRNGEPFIRPEHIPVFATAVGENCISPEAHVRMVAAVQSFISGGISKTVNMPNSATVEDVDKIYRLAHELGCKSIAIYRDGCKLSQPLSEGVRKPDTDSSFLTKTGIHILSEPDDNDLPSAKKTEFKPTRRRLPKRRFGYTNEYTVDGQKLFLRTGEYDDGTLGEVFVNLSKEGSTARALMEAWAKAVSLGLQFGVPLEKFVNSFTHIRFEPAGIVSGHDQIKMCSSLIDLVMRDLGISYLNRFDLSHVTPSASYTASELENVIQTVKDRYFEMPDVCWECGQSTLIRTGTCLECTNCHANTGCG